jgi:1-acyl-sn-glycerol-3-phosphate acyltransferase
MFYYFARAVCRALFRIVGRWDVKGQEHVPATGGVILAVNHTSYADPPAAGCAVRRRCWFLAKEELFRNPLFGWLIRALGAFSVKRGSPDIGALRHALRLLKEGKCLIVFPEGTRMPPGQLGEAEPGVCLIVQKSGAPVVPVYLHDTHRFLPPGSIFIRPAKIRVRVGEPITFPSDTSSGREGLTRIGERIMTELAKLKGKVQTNSERHKAASHTANRERPKLKPH